MWLGRLWVKHEVILSEVHFQTSFINTCRGFSGLVVNCNCCRCHSCGRCLFFFFLNCLVALMENHFEGFFPTPWQLGLRRKGQKPFKEVDVVLFMEAIILALEMSLQMVSLYTDDTFSMYTVWSGVKVSTVPPSEEGLLSWPQWCFQNVWIAVFHSLVAYLWSVTGWVRVPFYGAERHVIPLCPCPCDCWWLCKKAEYILVSQGDWGWK